ncbi:bifunctional DNA-formamidopyrimidine glycosylase/DNA-(apurinic or apyrimidinic site) lyase [Psychrobacter sp. I-STPA10]|uniref:bifunctional DNA-formamidopyrimidine glycosylase/DNA-(apurinic or apyrimidinic site) lyase n=1 Tax=Psychrobacter sp. I-STPA10 TaxID=2585769 RepID=UPI001E30E34D|nr:bifunctional DNA-formamidopyrimidine glycosylase/DNA-(apurinic or apyrimidinic site) lyase [Psychrobacter sp. I-STPA10]
MPELPEVETTKTSLTPLLGNTVTGIHVHCKKLRWAVANDLDSLIGYHLKKVERRAKYLILTFIKEPSCSIDTQATNNAKTSPLTVNEKKLIIHLGMSGSLQQYTWQSKKRKHDHVIIEFSNSQNQPIQLHYHDPRRFGAIVWYEDYADKLLSHLGVEPLTDGFNAEYLYHNIHPNPPKKRAVIRPIKAVIMDQKYVVGVGNIYATESLFLSHIHPLTPANQLTKIQLKLLIEHIKNVLNTSIQQGGSSLKDFSVANGQTGYFQQTLHVYGKYNQPCPICGETIEKVNITGRSSTFCPNCQPYDKKAKQ